MTDVVRRRGLFEVNPFVLIDVGCAGGIDQAWRAFGPSLVAHGYDIDVEACEQAQSRETFPHVRYHARYVGLPATHPFVLQRQADASVWPNTNIWPRITAAAVADLQSANEVYPEPSRLADQSTLLGVADIVREQSLATVDFLKIDVDGPDVEVLESARDVLHECHVLGVGLEVNWFGSASLSEHTFHNTDRFLRSAGYELFGVTVRTYSRRDLPAPFEFEFFAQTRFGQPYQGDAIYVRDLAAPHNRELAQTYSPEKLVKLACIYELIGLPDCAAEVVNRFQPEVARVGDTEELLDALTPPLLGRRVSYREYIEAFNRNPHLFLPCAAASAGGPLSGAHTSGGSTSPVAMLTRSIRSAARRVGGRVKRAVHAVADRDTD